MSARRTLLLTALGVLAAVGPGCETRDTIPLRDARVARVDRGPNEPTPPPDAGPGFFRRPDGGAVLPSADRQIVLPYQGPEATEDFAVESEVGTLDVFFNIDTTGSFSGEIDALQSDLRSRILPALNDRVADVAIGVGRFEDFPRQPFGETSDRPFRLLTAVTTLDSRAASAVAGLDQPLGNGGDIPESGAEALYQIATGEGLDGFVEAFDGDSAPGGGVVGGVGFREDALRVVVQVSDAPTHEPPDYAAGGIEGTHDLSEAIAALGENGIRMLGIASEDGARDYLERVALGTEAAVEADDGFCPTGVDGRAVPARGDRCPLVFSIREDGTGLADAVIDAMVDLLATVSYREVHGAADDPLGFVAGFESLMATPPAGVPAPATADRRPAGDGIDDTFVDVRPGTSLELRAILRNTTIPPADYDQFFNLTLRIVGDGVTLSSRTVRVVVPRGRADD